MSSLATAITSYMLALWLKKHQAWCSDYGQGPVCGARPLPMSGYGPENIRKRPLCTLLLTGLCVCWGALLSHRLGQSFSCPTPRGPSGSPGPFLAKPVSSGSWGLNLPTPTSPKARPCLQQGDTGVMVTRP